jgi:hypothetical protein
LPNKILLMEPSVVSIILCDLLINLQGNTLKRFANLTLGLIIGNCYQ